MTFQQIIERLLRSKLYGTPVILELETGETSSGAVKDLVYDGSRSEVVLDSLAGTRGPRRLRLASIRRVAPARTPGAA